jgi:hypothetical protein
MAVMLFFGSIQLISLGILGEYIGKIYMSAKQRPHYILREASSHPAHENTQVERR